MQTFPILSTAVLSEPLVALLLVILVLILLALIVAVSWFGSQVRNLTHPIYDFVLKDAEKKADQVIRDAGEQARAIRTRAEMEAGKLLVDRKRDDQILKEQYEKQIEEVVAQGKHMLNQEVAAAERLSEKALSALEEHRRKTESALEEEMRMVEQTLLEERKQIQNQFSTLSSRIEKSYGELLVNNRERVSEAIAEEIESVRKAIASYRSERLALIDEELVSLVEETARIALNRTLSLKEHADVVHKSLEEAKRRGIFGK